MTKRILALEKDLFFSVKMRDTLRHHDMEVMIARTLPAFEQHLDAPTEQAPALVIVNPSNGGASIPDRARRRAPFWPVPGFPGRRRTGWYRTR